MQAQIEESDKKVESVVVAFHNLNKEIWIENNEQTPRPQEENDKKKEEFRGWKGKRTEKEDSLSSFPCRSHIAFT